MPNRVPGPVAPLCCAPLCIALLLAAAPPVRADPLDVRDLGDLFARACVRQLGQPAAVARWAAGEQLRPLADPRELRSYAGSSTGTAWQLDTPGNGYVLAIRGGSGCAVFAVRADPAAAAAAFGAIAALLPAGLGIARALPERDEFGPNGREVTRVLIGFEPDGNRVRSTMMLTTRERTGGSFQATMQLAALPPRP